jgi:hypothetical protein
MRNRASSTLHVVGIAGHLSYFVRLTAIFTGVTVSLLRCDDEVYRILHIKDRVDKDVLTFHGSSIRMGIWM